MKQVISVVLVCAIAVPAWAAEKISVSELEQRIQSLRDAQKCDQEVRTKLAEVELTEAMPAATLNMLENLLPGHESQEQLKFLAVQSAILPPPAAEIPSLHAPDLATQKAIISKCVDYVTKIYMKNPHLSATKVTTFPSPFGQDATTHSMEIESEDGVEKAPPAQKKNDLIPTEQVSTGPVLSFVLAQAAKGGHLAWQRWQLINGKPSAVFSFSVDKTRSRYEVNFCCFQNLERAHFANGDFYVGPGAQPFKKTVPFHGAFYIDPTTGTVLRLIMQPEFSPADSVHREDTRIEYGPVKVDDKTLTVPIRAYLQVAVVGKQPNTLGYMPYSSAEYQNYRLVSASAASASR